MRDGQPSKPARTREDRGFFGRVLAVLLMGVGVVAIACLLWYARRIVLLAFAGALFALFLQTPASWLSRRFGLRYGGALTIVVLLFCALIASGLFVAGGRLAQQLSQLSAALPESG